MTYSSFGKWIGTNSLVQSISYFSFGKWTETNSVVQSISDV